MAIEVLTSSKTYLGPYDFTCQTSKGTLEASTDVKDVTTFCSGGWTEVKGGLRKFESMTEGYWDSAAADAVDPQAFTNLGSAGQVLTVAPVGAEGGPAYLGQVLTSKYTLFDAVGEVAPFTLAAQGSSQYGAVRGGLLLAKTSLTTTGAKGTVMQLGAVGATQFLYVAVHLIGTAGTSITVTVESDNASNFPSATLRATTGSLTAVGGTWITPVAGAITDDWWRVNVTAISGTWLAAVSAGIA